MDIYDVNEDLIKAITNLKLIQMCSTRFNKIAENHDKVNFVEELLVKFQQIPKLELKIELRVPKNEEKSLSFRKDGNEYFSLKNKDYFKALHLYNKSICFAENDSENISIGYANRSAILFEWKRYRECLENIKLAKEAGYPKRLLHKLTKREKDCLDLLDSQPPDEETFDFKLTYEKHPKVPFIADCLDLKCTEELGRYVYTKKSLNPGDLVSIEDAFCSVLLPHMKYIRCANCKRENYMTLIPCPYCTSAMFCSANCMEEGQRSFHRFECPIIDFLFSLFNKIHLTALRVSLITLTMFDTPEESMTFCEDPNNQNQCSFDLDYDNFTKKECYRAIHGLVTNQTKRLTGDLFQRAVIAAVLKKFILANTSLSEILSDKKHEHFFISLLFRHLQTSASNMHGVDLIEQQNETREDQTFASAAYAFGSLLNHSCAPNVVRVFKGTTIYLFILRPIPENGILFDNYGYHFATQPKKIRQTNLKRQYLFDCNCEACANEYPLYNNLPIPDVVPEAMQADDFYSILAFDKQFAAENYQRFWEFLTKYSQFYPCAQICTAEESLKMALNILLDSVPLKAKF